MIVLRYLSKTLWIFLGKILYNKSITYTSEKGGMLHAGYFKIKFVVFTKKNIGDYKCRYASFMHRFGLYLECFCKSFNERNELFIEGGSVYL